MPIITKAPPAAPLELKDTLIHLFPQRDRPKIPAMLAVSGSAGHECELFNITATGKVSPKVPMNLILRLYARPSYPPEADALDVSEWTEIAVSQPAAIGGSEDFRTTSFMLQGSRLMFNLDNGKLQGTFVTNIADSPQADIGLTHNLQGIEANADPMIVFALGASSDVTTRGKAATTAELELVNFTMEGP
jgi:hypothetical protein